jgi:predicted nucleic acid-binding protein
VTKSGRFVFDTNVLVSAALRRRSLPRQALDHALEHGGLLVSEATVRELRAVLFHPQFDTYVTEAMHRLLIQPQLFVFPTAVGKL